MNNQRILIVEDEPIVAMELRETLTKAGYFVVGSVESADDVLSMVQATLPDLVIMDIRLKSFIDGVDVVKRIRLFSDMPIIFTTAYSTDDIRKRADATHPDAFLVKPVAEEDLLNAVKAALERRTIASV
jgi:two-component system, response regulator PdtaR